MTTLDLYGLGVHSQVSVQGSDALVDALRAAWSRCLVPRGGEIEGGNFDLAAEGEQAALLQRFTQDVTWAAIKAQRGRLYMFHAGAVTDPATGAALAYIAPGGTGKTTLSQVLGRTHGYVTDEAVGFTLDGHIHPYEKPLSVRQNSFQGLKDELSPDALGLVPVHPGAHLRRCVLIRRDSALEHPTVEKLSVVDAIMELTSESSSLSSLNQPLRGLAGFLDQCPPTVRVTYSEAEDVRDLLIDLLEES